MAFAFLAPFNTPDMPAFGGGASESVMHPVVIVTLAIAMVLIVCLPRKYVIIPFLLCTFLVPCKAQLYVLGTHWYVSRILALGGAARLVRGKFRLAGGWNEIDKIFMVWAVARVVCPVLLVPQTGQAIYQAGILLDAIGSYFLLRHIIQDQKDIARAGKTLAALAMILGAFMLNERINHLNLFGYLGGTPIIPVVRDGQIRAQAIFGHPILAGSFGATLVPLFFWLWKGRQSKLWACCGVIGATLMVISSWSSTSLLAYAGAVFALFLWPIRKYMRAVRLGIVAALVGMQLVMNAPVWFVLQYMNVIGASGGWDRAYLIDVFVRHFREWWLIGTNQMGSWGYDMWDLSNQFVAEGETGGLVTFVCFILLISRGFSRLGRMRKQVSAIASQEWVMWSLGAVLFAHILAFFGVSYWDQVQIWWWTALAMISAATVPLQKSAKHAPRAGRKTRAVPQSELERRVAITTVHSFGS